MNWGRYIQRTAVRRVVWIVVGALVYGAWAFLSPAHAQLGGLPPDGGGVYFFGSEAAARSSCESDKAAAESRPNAQVNSSSCGSAGSSTTYNGVRFVDVFCDYYEGRHRGCREGQETGFPRSRYAWPLDPICPVGTEWRDDLKQCFDESECYARNQMEGFANVGATVRPFSSKCIAGCRFSASDSQCSVVAGSAQQMCTGNYEWGGACEADPPAPGDPFIPDTYETPEGAASESGKEEGCIPGSSGQNICLKRNGQACYTASTGREICWDYTEVGEKSDNNILQKRNPGPTEIPPSNPNLPTGDTLEKSGDSVTVETTKKQGNTSTTTVTTTTNYQTTHGTNPGQGNQGQPEGTPGGSGSGTGGEGDDDKGTVDGGGDCDSPPIVRGGDPVQAAVVNQTWATRCAVKAGNAAKVTGDVGDCKSPFTVEGDNANAVKLRAMREQICKEGERAENQGISDGLEGSINAMESEFSSIFGDGSGQGAGSISTTRYGGGGSCPAISIEIPWGGTWVPPPVFCDVIAALRLLFLAITTIVALRIIGS